MLVAPTDRRSVLPESARVVASAADCDERFSVGRGRFAVGILAPANGRAVFTQSASVVVRAAQRREDLSLRRKRSPRAAVVRARGGPSPANERPVMAQGACENPTAADGPKPIGIKRRRRLARGGRGCRGGGRRRRRRRGRRSRRGGNVGRRRFGVARGDCEERERGEQDGAQGSGRVHPPHPSTAGGGRPLPRFTPASRE